MGRRKPNLNELAREIKLWCEARKIWLSAYHIPGKLNTKTDALSRFSKKLNDDMEWSLNDTVFNKIESKMGKCDIDLFASAKNFKIDKYASFVPDIRAYAVNAFSLTWTNASHYIFPPFSMLGAVLQKIRLDQARATLIALLFTTQPWFPQILQPTCGHCYILPKMDNLLSIPNKKQKHPLKSMKIGVFKISGDISEVTEFQKRLPMSSLPPGEIAQRNSMGHISKNGCTFAVKGKLVTLTHL